MRVADVSHLPEECSAISLVTFLQKLQLECQLGCQIIVGERLLCMFAAPLAAKTMILEGSIPAQLWGAMVLAVNR